MHYRISFIFVTFICLFGFVLAGRAQDANTDESSKPVILYSGTPKKYEIADIKVEGVKNYEDYVLIGLSGLSVGQTISVPGDEITSAIKRYWRHGLFSNVQITAEKIEGNKIWLKISLTQRPRISEIRYHGVKKSERQDLETRLGLVKGSQITPNLVDRAKTLIKRYFDDKGFKNAEIIISQKDDVSNENQVIVDVNIDKKEKVKVHEITIVGNKAIKTSKLKRVMKKTNEKGKLKNLFRTKKFINEKYEEDKQLIIDKYNELGYRDAVIVVDSVSPYDEKTVNVYIEIEEGDKYYLRNVTWVGNTLYPSEQLNYLLRMKKGDVYNQKLLNERLSTDEDAIGNLSGGNQQKVVVGKWLARNSKVVIFDEPTRGIDVAAKVEIYNLMNELKKQGIAVMFVSSEMPEVMGIADRIIVMCDGRITGELDARNTTQNEILTLATQFEKKIAANA